MLASGLPFSYFLPKPAFDSDATEALAMSQYAMVAIERVKQDVVTFPDGEIAITPHGEGNAAAARWNKLQDEEQHGHRATQTAQVEAQRTRWMDDVVIERIEAGRKQGAPFFIDRVTFPNGEVEEFDADATDGEIRATAAEEYPLVLTPETKPAYASVAVRGTWVGELFLPDGRETLDLAPEQWSYGFPIEEAVLMLNKLAESGWRVVHASEDRGLYAGGDTATDAYVTRVRYLLMRDKSRA